MPFPLSYVEPILRFMPKFELGAVPAHNPELGQCWEWIAGKNHQGYAKFKWEGRTRSGHIFAYEYFIGPVPEGFQLDHLCRNKSCVNPWHLEPVTGSINVFRGPNKHREKTHCKNGHEFTTENTYVTCRGKYGRSQRHCRTCHRIQVRNAYRADVGKPLSTQDYIGPRNQYYKESSTSMFVNTKVVIDMNSGEILSKEGFEYTGPVEQFCGGASSEQKEMQALQIQAYQTALSQTKEVFGDGSKIFNLLSSTFSPILKAGPDQFGYGTAETTALRSGATQNQALATATAGQSLREELAAQGGGNTFLPSGAQAKLNAGIATTGSNNLAAAQNQITQAGFDQGRQNWMNAAKVLGGATSVFDPGNSATNASTSAGSAAEKSAKDVTDSNQAANQMWAGLAGSLAGSASGTKWFQ